MASYNRIIMMGNLTRDPEYKQLASGQNVCRLGLASNRQFKNKQTGSMVQEVCFIDIDVWGAQADSCQQYLAKGRSILVEGRLKLDTWQDNDGNRRSKHSIVADRVTFLSNAQDASQGQHDGQQSPTPSTSNFGGASMAPAANPVAQSISNDIVVEPIKAATTSKASGEIDFKDEKPFEDDLPF